jgi:hypothetical protein
LAARSAPDTRATAAAAACPASASDAMMRCRPPSRSLLTFRGGGGGGIRRLSGRGGRWLRPTLDSDSDSGAGRGVDGWVGVLINEIAGGDRAFRCISNVPKYRVKPLVTD